MKKQSLIITLIMMMFIVISATANAEIEFSGSVTSWLLFPPNAAPQGYLWVSTNAVIYGKSGRLEAHVDTIPGGAMPGVPAESSFVFGTPGKAAHWVFSGGYIKGPVSFWEGGQSVMTTLGSITVSLSPYVATYNYDKGNINNLKGIAIDGYQLLNKKAKLSLFGAFESTPNTYVYGGRLSTSLGSLNLSATNATRVRTIDFVNGINDVLESSNAAEVSLPINDKSKLALVYVTSEGSANGKAEAVKANIETSVLNSVNLKGEYYDVDPNYNPTYRSRVSWADATPTDPLRTNSYANSLNLSSLTYTNSYYADTKGYTLAAETKIKNITLSSYYNRNQVKSDPLAGASETTSVKILTKILNGDLAFEVKDFETKLWPSITTYKADYTLPALNFNSGSLTGMLTVTSDDSLVDSRKNYARANLKWTFTKGICKGLTLQACKTVQHLSAPSSFTEGFGYSIDYTGPGGIRLIYRFNNQPTLWPLAPGYMGGENVTAITATVNF